MPNNLAGALEEKIVTIFIVIQFLLILFLFFLGLWAVDIYLLRKENDDPQEVIIDELVGQLLVIVFSYFILLIVSNTTFKTLTSQGLISLFFFLILPLGLFRFFDIVKPWPINWIEKNIKGSAGVMLDDILAAIYANTSYCFVVFLVINNKFFT